MPPRKNSERSSASHNEDLSLARAAAAGDETARRQFAERLFNRTRTVAHYLAAGDPDAEDYAQLAMIELLHAAGSYRGESSLGSWAERIVVRTVMRHLKRRKWRATIVQLDPEADVSVTESIEEEVVRGRVTKRVTALLGELKPKHRVALFLKSIAGYSLDEVADITRTGRHTVDYRIRRGREQLSRKMRRDPLLREWIGMQETER